MLYKDISIIYPEIISEILPFKHTQRLTVPCTWDVKQHLLQLNISNVL